MCNKCSIHALSSFLLFIISVGSTFFVLGFVNFRGTRHHSIVNRWHAALISEILEWRAEWRRTGAGRLENMPFSRIRYIRLIVTQPVELVLIAFSHFLIFWNKVLNIALSRGYHSQLVESCLRI